MKCRICVAILAVLLVDSAVAEFRTWTGSTGSQIKAELVKEADGKVILRDETGRELKVPRSYLSAVDIAYLDSHIVPTLGIKPSIRVQSEYITGAGVVQRVHYSIEVRKVSSADYHLPVTIMMYLVGSIGDEPTYVVLQRTEKQVRFTAEIRNPSITGPALSLGSPEMQRKHDVDYIGYLILAVARDGRIISIESDHDMLETNAGFIGKFKAGDLFGADMKLLE
jgi:hypothetical protein